jgi:hypothetical protein
VATLFSRHIITPVSRIFTPPTEERELPRRSRELGSATGTPLTRKGKHLVPSRVTVGI